MKQKTCTLIKNFFWSLKNIAHLKKNSSDKIANLFVCLFGESFTHIRQNIKNVTGGIDEIR